MLLTTYWSVANAYEQTIIVVYDGRHNVSMRVDCGCVCCFRVPRNSGLNRGPLNRTNAC
jgi:hypothetical protein